MSKEIRNEWRVAEWEWGICILNTPRSGFGNLWPHLGGDNLNQRRPCAPIYGAVQCSVTGRIEQTDKAILQPSQPLEVC
jgi:hypothetical protein